MNKENVLVQWSWPILGGHSRMTRGRVVGSVEEALRIVERAYSNYEDVDILIIKAFDHHTEVSVLEDIISALQQRLKEIS